MKALKNMLFCYYTKGRKKVSMIMKTLSKELRRILRENNKMAVIYTGTKLGSKILFQEVTIMI